MLQVSHKLVIRKLCKTLEKVANILFSSDILQYVSLDNMRNFENIRNILLETV